MLNFRPKIIVYLSCIKKLGLCKYRYTRYTTFSCIVFRTLIQGLTVRNILGAPPLETIKIVTIFSFSYRNFKYGGHVLPRAPMHGTRVVAYRAFNLRILRRILRLISIPYEEHYRAVINNLKTSGHWLKIKKVIKEILTQSNCRHNSNPSAVAHHKHFIDFENSCVIYPESHMTKRKIAESLLISQQRR